MIRSVTVPARRRGVALLMVVLLLTLFAVLALSFLLYAGASAESARVFRESEQVTRADVRPEVLLNYFLGQFIYDVPDDESGAYSALRGHSLARNAYGADGGPGPSASPPSANVVPFNGVGRLQAPSPFGTLVPGVAVNDARLLNYTYYPDDPQLPVAQRFLRDPERLGWRPADPGAPRGAYTGGLNAPYTYPDLNSPFLAAVRADGTVLLPSFHRPWAADVADSGLPAGAGEFYDRTTGQLNPLWSSNPPQLPPWFKYTTLRPLPALNPGFPPPEDGGGDVKNLRGGPGTLRGLLGDVPVCWNNDSSWMDLGFPVLTAPSGRRFKPLFAALVVDLDGRVNVNVHGNTQGAGGGHASNQGWGPWEVNLGRVLNRGNGQEWCNLLQGTAAPPLPGRYGGRPWAGQPGTPGAPGDVAPPWQRPHFHSQVDFDGVNELTRVPSSRPLLPGLGGPPGSCFPSFTAPDGSYGGYGNGSADERRGHAQLYNPIRPAGGNRRFSAANTAALLRHDDTGSRGVLSDLFRLCPVNFSDPRVRRMVTTHSADLDRPGVPPWLFDPASAPYEVPPTTDPDRPALPTGPLIGFPDVATKRGTPPPGGSEFGGADWRALSASLGRIDLGRPLPPYPHMGSGKMPPFGPPLTVVAGQVALDLPFTVDAPNGPIWKQFVLAQDARQRLAGDIYRRLLVVTGVPPILPDQDPQAPPPELLRSRRWLAQLAVNIVDYLDEDDVSTPFCFYTAEDYRHLPLPHPPPPDPGRVDPSRRADGPDGEIQWPLYWVFGTELPRVVVNEVMAETRRVEPYEAYRDRVRVFVELHHTFPRAVPATVYQPDSYPLPLRMSGATAAYCPYRVLVGVRSPVAWRDLGTGVLPGADNDNVLGNPDPAVVRAATTDDDFLAPLATLGGDPQAPWPGAGGPPAYRALASPYVPAHGPVAGAPSQGFLLLGPPEVPPYPTPPPKTLPPPHPFFARDPFLAVKAGATPPATPLLRTAGLEYPRRFLIRSVNDPPDERTQGVTVLLRRLANPYLPFDGTRRGPNGSGPNFTYNPYVTVDYVEGIPLQAVGGGARFPIASVGKRQPYAAFRTQLAAQEVGPNPDLRCSFGLENVPGPPHYDWLTHLDRPPISPAELLHVSGYQPYQLTQRFLSVDESGLPASFAHRAPWLDEDQSAASHRLYRLFEFLGAGAAPAGVAAGGRVPGKVNINTVWDPEILQALCDPQPANSFRDADVNDLFFRLLHDGRPGAPEGPQRRTAGLVPGDQDRPFWGLGAGAYPAGDAQFPTGGGTGDTVLRLLPPSAGAHPYLDSELLTKVFSQLTTRSNVFAVWLTVGFFEVTDETTRPVKLGPELGRSEMRHVRHRMFAIIDRTGLSIASCVASLRQGVQASPGSPSLRTVPVSALDGTTPLPVTGPTLTWAIKPGTVLVVDTGANQESVPVLAVDANGKPPTFTAVFSKSHAAGAPLALADTAGAPPLFLKPLSTERPDPSPQPPYAPRPPYPVVVRLSVDPQRSGATVLAGEYDGLAWAIRPGTRLIIDVGPNQEAVTVEKASFGFDKATATGTFRVTVTRDHADGFPISNTLPGNPGPQRDFDPLDPRFAAVVRYLSVMQ